MIVRDNENRGHAGITPVPVPARRPRDGRRLLADDVMPMARETAIMFCGINTLSPISGESGREQ